jgi:predicted ATPase/DNA-binding winged helix-turn-helix (wHTH) protein
VSAPAVAYRFGPYRLLPGERTLLVDGEPAKLGGRAFDLLVALVERRERTVTRSELFDLVWPGRIVEDHNLQVQVLALRKLLGPRAIATVPGRGYRFAQALDESTPAAVVPAAAPPEPLPAAPAGASPTALTNLPAALPALHGRVADIATVCQLLGEHRLISIAGAGGIGKTRLAQAVASQLRARFADGVWMVELAPLHDDAELICCTAARALGLSDDRFACTVDGVAHALSSLELLLVLDNCEHVVDSVSAFVQALLKAAPKVRVLATSQEPLRVGGEHVFRLGPLPLPPSPAEQALRYGAVSLFVERVRAADRRFALTDDNVATVVDICRRLDGVPLALELASARVPLLGVEGVRARIDERFRLLVGGARDAPARHRTLHSALEWSHSLLGPAEQAVFRRLGVFAGGFSLAAAQKVAADSPDDEWAVLDHLGVLVDKSLVVAEGDGEPRLRLLESSRAFALEALAGSGESVSVRRRHARVYMELFAQADDVYFTEPTLAWIARLAPDLNNVRDAFAFSMSSDGEPQVAIGIAAVGATFAAATGRGREGHRALIRVWSLLPEHAAPEWVGRVWLGVAQLGTVQAVLPPEALHAAQQAADAFRNLGDRVRLYGALYLQSQYAENSGEVSMAASADDEMRRIESAQWPAGLKRLGRLREARTLRRHGRIADYRDAYAAEALRCAAAGDPYRAWLMFHHVALGELSLGNVDAAVEVMDEVVGQIRQLGLQREMWQQVAMHALARIEQGDPGFALPAAREAVALLRVQGALWWLADHLAWLPAQRGDWAAAAQLLGWADACARSRAAQRGPVMQKARDRLAERLAAALQADELTRLQDEGAALRDEQVIAVALAQTP